MSMNSSFDDLAAPQSDPKSVVTGFDFSAIVNLTPYIDKKADMFSLIYIEHGKHDFIIRARNTGDSPDKISFGIISRNHLETADSLALFLKRYSVNIPANARQNIFDQIKKLPRKKTPASTPGAP